jgi:hypothetical protein
MWQVMSDTVRRCRHLLSDIDSHLLASALDRHHARPIGASNTIRCTSDFSTRTHSNVICRTAINLLKTARVKKFNLTASKIL